MIRVMMIFDLPFATTMTTSLHGIAINIKLACVLFSLIALTYIVIAAKEILSPLIFSCLFSILLLPLAAFIENKLRLPRSVASMLAVVSLLACIGGLIYVIGSQISSLASDWPQFQASCTNRRMS